MMAARTRAGLTAFAVVGMLAALGPATAGAAFPGQNGKIAFARDDGTDFEIFVMDVSGQNQIRLTDDSADDFDPAFSPDGQRIAFTARTATDEEIFVMDADGQNQAPLTSNPLPVSQPAFSPDGQRIAFTGRDATDTEIFVMDATGLNQIPLTANSDDDSAPAFSPDGQRIVFSFREPGDLFIMDSDGQNQMPLDENPLSDTDPAFSPDGERIAFTRFAGGDSEIMVMDASGQNEAPLTSNSATDFGPDWQPLNPPVLDLAAARKQKSLKVVSATATLGNEDATLAVGGTIKAPKVARAAGARPAKSKTFSLTPQTIELQPGQPAALSLAIPKKARKLLKRGFAAGKKGTAALTATATDDLGESSQDSQSVKLKRKRKKK
jgi:dipeptidyl aminopeptidase/acylaminoacyl peptidase